MSSSFKALHKLHLVLHKRVAYYCTYQAYVRQDPVLSTQKKKKDDRRSLALNLLSEQCGVCGASAFHMAW